MSDVERGTVALDRLIFFSDAVFAIAMTLLVLAIPRPAPGDHDIRGFLTTQDGKFVAYFISFWVISLYWIAHHRLFRVVQRFDQGVLFLNLVELFFIAFLPYPSAILGDHATNVAATVFYALIVSAVGVASTLLAWYTVMYRDYAKRLPSQVVRYYVFRGLIAPAVFLASIPVAFASVQIAQLLWLLTLLVPLFGIRLARRFQARERAKASSGRDHVPQGDQQ